MLSIKKNLGLLAMTAALAACASNPNDRRISRSMNTRRPSRWARA